MWRPVSTWSTRSIKPLGVLANSQGTMNNFTFGDAERQYYETICGGAGAPAPAGPAPLAFTPT